MGTQDSSSNMMRLNLQHVSGEVFNMSTIWQYHRPNLTIIEPILSTNLAHKLQAHTAQAANYPSL